MHLQRITLERFGALDQQEYSFEPGLNLIKGPNEAGKSTLQDAILFVLFGNPRHTTLQRTKRMDDYVAWDAGKPFCLTLCFMGGDGIAYRLEKDWAAGDACLTDVQSGDVVEEGADAVQRRLDAMLGYGSVNVFQSTACVEQDAIDDLSDGQKKISDHLQSIVTGGGDKAAVSDVLESLEDEIGKMQTGLHRPAKYPGPIKQKRDDLKEIKEELSEARAQVARLEKTEDQLSGLEERLGQIEKKLTTLPALKQRCDERFDWEEKLDTWREKEGNLDRKIEKIEEAQRQIEQAEEALAAYSGFDTLDIDVEERLSGLHHRVEALREEIGRKAAKLEQLKAQRIGEEEVRPGVPVGPLVGVGLGVALILIGLLVGLSNLLFVGALIGVGSLVWLVMSLNQPHPSDLGSRVTACKEDLAEKRRKLQGLTGQLTEALEAFGCDTWDEFSRKLAGYRDRLSQRRAAETRYDALLGDQTLEALVEQRKDASRELRQAKEKIEEPAMRKAGEVTPQRYEEIKQEIESLEEEQAMKQEEMHKHRAFLENARYTVEDVHRLGERKADAERDLTRLEEQLAVYRLTREVLEEAKEQTMRSARDELEPRVGDYLNRITRGRYDTVEADDDLKLRLFSAEKDDWIDAEGEELSGGTVDQLYLAARLALIDLLFRDAKPPLLMDDPFVTFDPQRRQEALQLCQEITEEHQVLFFTCHDVYDEVTDKVLTL